jgi:hypothetical protein
MKAIDKSDWIGSYGPLREQGRAAEDTTQGSCGSKDPTVENNDQELSPSGHLLQRNLGESVSTLLNDVVATPCFHAQGLVKSHPRLLQLPCTTMC